MPISTNSIYLNGSKLLLLLIALGFLNFEKYYIFTLVIIYILWALSNAPIKIKLTKQIVPLTFWGLIYSVYYFLDTGNIAIAVIYYLIGPIVAYLVGYKISRIDGKKEKDIILLIILICIAFCFHGILNVIFSIINGSFNLTTEYVYDIWSRNYNNRTIMGIYLTPIVCIGITLLLFGRDYYGEVTRWIIILLAISSLLASIFIGNRSIIIISLVIVISCVFFGFRIEKKKMKFLIMLSLLVIIGSLFYAKDIFSIRSFIEDSYLFVRISRDGFNTSRTLRYKEIFNNIHAFWGGWIIHGDRNLKTWTHNVWIDIYTYTGVAGLVAFIIYTINIIISTFRIYNGKFHISTKLIILNLSIGLFLTWSTEPILSANPYYFSICCFIFSIFENMYYSNLGIGKQPISRSKGEAVLNNSR